MQEQMITTTVETIKRPKVRAQKKHIVMFTIACVILVLGILAQFLTISAIYAYVQDMNADFDASEAAFPGLAEAVMGLGSLLIFFMGIIASNFLRDVVWITGLVLCIRLTRRKKELPKWMWVISLVMRIVYSVYIGADILIISVWLLFAVFVK